jgi:hypothetical protein
MAKAEATSRPGRVWTNVGVELGVFWRFRWLATGADPSAGDDAGYTPLHVAVQERYVLVIELLLKSGADANAVDKYSNGPLWTL